MTIEDDSKKKQYKKFQKLDEAWREEQMGAQTPDLYKKITQIAINDVQLAMAKEFDPDLKNLKEQVKVANEPYSLGHKENVTRIEFIVSCLKDRGENVPDIDQFIKAAANAVDGKLDE